jgi:hypothetical protein
LQRALGLWLGQVIRLRQRFGTGRRGHQPLENVYVGQFQITNGRIGGKRVPGNLLESLAKVIHNGWNRTEKLPTGRVIDRAGVDTPHQLLGEIPGMLPALAFLTFP